MEAGGFWYKIRQEEIPSVENGSNFVIVKVDGQKAHLQAMRPNGESIEITELGH